MSSARGIRVCVTLGVLAIVLGPATSTQAAAHCTPVAGSYVERPVTGPSCTSPVGLCIEATYRGDISGVAEGRATSIVPTADTPTTTVQLFTSDSTLTGKTRGRTGTLLIKNAGAFASGGDGSIVDLQTITGGTGYLAGVTGAIRAQGTFSFPDGGRSRYTGTVCFH
ncbi:DUF3224 domain-containing protein [Krasilnikovia sp. MM14-A1259]|uniref:DUF3224 domain-containing protein n=1 Tax=Krasilnikovia sp. MM14-A1259 TaxID=3373539 RepID=UPI00380A00C8